MKQIWIEPYTRGYKGNCPRCQKEQINKNQIHVDVLCHQCEVETKSIDNLNSLCGVDAFISDFGDRLKDVYFYKNDEFDFLRGGMVITGASGTRYEIIVSHWDKMVRFKILKDGE